MALSDRDNREIDEILRNNPPRTDTSVCEGVSNDHPFVDFSRFIDGTYHPEYRDTPATQWEQLSGKDVKRFGKFLPR